MNREYIIRMAREAGWPGIYAKPLLSITLQEDDFLRFAALVAAAEREACALTCEGISMDDMREDSAAQDCAAAIRARGKE